MKDSAVASPFSKGAQGIYVENDSDRQEMDGSLHSKHLQATNTVSSDDEEAELNVRMKAKLRQKTGQNVFPKLSCATTQPKPNDVQSKKVVQSNQSNSQSTLFGYFGSK